MRCTSEVWATEQHVTSCKWAQPWTSTAVKCNVYINAAVILIKNHQYLIVKTDRESVLLHIDKWMRADTYFYSTQVLNAGLLIVVLVYFHSFYGMLFPSFGAELWPIVSKLRLKESWVKFHSLQNISGASQKETNEVGEDLGGWSLHRSESSKVFAELESSL